MCNTEKESEDERIRNSIHVFQIGFTWRVSYDFRP